MKNSSRAIFLLEAIHAIVRCYTFLEDLGYYRKTEHTVQIFFEHLEDFQDQNIQFFQNVTYISIKR